MQMSLINMQNFKTQYLRLLWDNLLDQSIKLLGIAPPIILNHTQDCETSIENLDIFIDMQIYAN